MKKAYSIKTIALRRKILAGGFSLLALLFSSIAHAQSSRTVRGVVLDDEGKGVPSVVVAANDVSTQRITTTDLTGNFSLKIEDGDTAIVALCTGYATARVPLGEGDFYTIRLELEQIAIDDVIVTGFQRFTQKDRVTGSYSVLNAQKIDRKLESNLLQRLEGMTAGIVIGPNGTPLIRGVATLKGGTAPLYVVDGLPFEGNIKSLTPSEIANITVLKDAAAASIYGARAANGVIVISTKRGREGETRVFFNSNLSINPLPGKKSLNYLSTSELIDLKRMAFDHYHSPSHMPQFP